MLGQSLKTHQGFPEKWFKHKHTHTHKNDFNDKPVSIRL